MAQPLVGPLHLPAVDDLLLEDAELVADAVAHGRDLQGRQRIDEAGRESPEATVAETGLHFLLPQFVEVEAKLADRLAHRVVDAQVDQLVAEVRSHQDFGGEVCHRPRTLRGVGQREVVVHPSRERRELALEVEEVVYAGAFQGLLAEAVAFIPGVGGDARPGPGR